MNLLDKITGPYKEHWSVLWFVSGSIAVIYGWFIGSHSTLETIKMVTTIIGLSCVVALTFRKNFANILGISANVGEIYTQGQSGATGLMLAPMFYIVTHVYGLYLWHKFRDSEGNMIARGGSAVVWVITVAFIGIGLTVFPWLNNQLQQFSFISNSSDTALSFAGVNISWYTINVIAFVLGVTAQTSMILRYSFSWAIWITVNFVFFAVNIVNHNTLFAIQGVFFQINAFLGLYVWWKNAQSQAQNSAPASGPDSAE